MTMHLPDQIVDRGINLHISFLSTKQLIPEMHPIMKSLKQNYRDHVKVVFHDV